MEAALDPNRLDLLNLLLDKTYCSPLHLDKVLAKAITSGHHHLLEPLLAAGSLTDSSAWDAALNSRNLHLTKIMITAGAPISQRSSTTLKTPVQVAVENIDRPLLDLLIQHGADVNAPATNSVKTTALQYAAIHGYMTLARMLLDAGADVDAVADVTHGRTALEGAAERGRIEMLYLLVKRGAQVRGGKQLDGAIEFARKEGHNAAAAWLRGVRSAQEAAGR
jgi:ankyrin repeat protein